MLTMTLAKVSGRLLVMSFLVDFLLMPVLPFPLSLSLFLSTRSVNMELTMLKRISLNNGEMRVWILPPINSKAISRAYSQMKVNVCKTADVTSNFTLFLRGFAIAITRKKTSDMGQKIEAIWACVSHVFLLFLIVINRDSKPKTRMASWSTKRMLIQSLLHRYLILLARWMLDLSINEEATERTGKAFFSINRTRFSTLSCCFWSISPSKTTQGSRPFFLALITVKLNSGPSSAMTRPETPRKVRGIY
mmetsp:Transcript_5671/g.11350  ORF Transcript_5671/g.11350 Transcript_5671/m.11350 type:complete len:248 (-) Transcript_5671:41-784(-)